MYDPLPTYDLPHAHAMLQWGQSLVGKGSYGYHVQPRRELESTRLHAIYQ